MQRPGNADSFTASNQVLMLDAALEQIPTEHRRDLLITIDGAGTSHEMVDHGHRVLLVQGQLVTPSGQGAGPAFLFGIVSGCGFLSVRNAGY